MRSDPRVILAVAQAAGLELKKVGEHEYAVKCPRPDSHQNQDAHPSCRLNDVRGVFHCDVCGIGGGIVDLARLLGVDLSGLATDPPPAVVLRKKTKQRGGNKTALHFVSHGPIGPATEATIASSLAKRYTPEAWQALKVEEGTVRGLPAIAFPLPSGGYKVCLHTRPDPKRGKPYTFWFTDGGKPDMLLIGDGDEVLLTAGEWDMLAALSTGFECVATGTGGEKTWKPEWSERLAGKSVCIIYDVDEAGVEGAQKVARAVDGIALQVVTVRLPLSGDPDGDGKDLSDYLALHPVDDLRTLISKFKEQAGGSAGSTPSEVPVSRIIDIVLGAAGPVRIKRREAAQIVISDLQARGELIQADGGRQFWFDKGNRRLLDIDGFPFRSMFMNDYEINPSEREFTHIMEAVKSAVLTNGKRATVCRFCFFDRPTLQLYIHAGRARVLRLDGTTIAWLENGADDLLFEENDDQQLVPEESPSLVITGDPLGEHIINRVNFTRGSGVILDPEQQGLVLRVWILSIFFPELLPAKNLLLMYGEKGSGKTTTLRTILKLLLGARANVTPLAKEDGFNATLSREFLIVLDNVDSFCRWIEDRLATVATGQTIKLRKLYTTNEMLSFPTRCCIALTARTPRFRRDDVVDRLQILRVARLEKFSREAEWYAEIEDHRAELWAQLLRDLNAVVACIKRGAIDAPETLRMADWGFVATTIGEALGRQDEVRRALEASELDKAHFLLEADELYDLVHAIANELPGKEWKAGELFAELKTRAENSRIDFVIKSPRSLGRILNRLEPALKLMIRFVIRVSPHDNQAFYTLGPLETEVASPARPRDRSEDTFHDPDF